MIIPQTKYVCAAVTVDCGEQSSIRRPTHGPYSVANRIGMPCNCFEFARVYVPQAYVGTVISGNRRAVGRPDNIANGLVIIRISFRVALLQQVDR